MRISVIARASPLDAPARPLERVMAWQSRVKDMERSFETAESTILAARRRGKRGKGRDATATMTRAGATMTRDANDAGEGESAREDEGRHGTMSDDSAARESPGETRVDVDETSTSGEAERRGDRGDARRGVEDEGVHGVPGMEDFGPAVDADVERPVMRRMRPKGETRAPAALLRALEWTRRLGLVGAAALFGMFLVLVAFAVYEEMGAMAPRDPLRPDFGPDGPIVDSMTVAEEAEARGESATAALLDVEREIKGGGGR